LVRPRRLVETSPLWSLARAGCELDELLSRLPTSQLEILLSLEHDGLRGRPGSVAPRRTAGEGLSPDWVA